MLQSVHAMCLYIPSDTSNTDDFAMKHSPIDLPSGRTLFSVRHGLNPFKYTYTGRSRFTTVHFTTFHINDCFKILP
jgi:hypothetical protein